MGHGRRRLGVRVGPAGRRAIHRRDPGGSGSRRQLDRHGGHLRIGPFRGGGGAGARRAFPSAVSLHQMRAGVEREAGDQPVIKGRFGAARMRSQPPAFEGGYHRPVPDPLAGSRSGPRGRLAGAGAAAEGRQSAVDRRLQFQREADGALPADRADYLSAAAVFRDFARGGKRDSAVLPAARHRGDCLFADEIGTADRSDDARTHREFSAGRLPAEGAEFSGAAPDTESGAAGPDEADRRAARAHRG